MNLFVFNGSVRQKDVPMQCNNFASLFGEVQDIFTVTSTGMKALSFKQFTYQIRHVTCCEGEADSVGWYCNGNHALFTLANGRQTHHILKEKKMLWPHFNQCKEMDVMFKESLKPRQQKEVNGCDECGASERIMFGFLHYFLSETI